MLRTLILLAAASLTLACAEDPDAPSPPPEGEPELSLAYISGHLGAYWDCPDQAMPARAEAAERRAGAPEADEDGLIAGDCADENCGLLNCEPAQMRLRITNDGADALESVDVKRLTLDWGAGDLSENEVLGIFDDTGVAFDGRLEPGESVDVRIDYRGPHPGDVDWDEGLPAVIEVGNDAGSEAITTPELQMVPQVAT